MDERSASGTRDERARAAEHRSGARRAALLGLGIVAALAVGGAAGFVLGARTVTPAAHETGAASPSAASSESESEPGLEPGVATGFPVTEPVEFQAGMPLSADRSVAPAYAFDAEGVEQDAVAALATMLGLEGDVEESADAWVVQSPDPSGPALQVSLEGTMPAQYADARKDAPCEGPCDPVPERDAESMLREMQAVFGQDPGSFEYVTYGEEPGRTVVNAFLVVDGQRIGMPRGEQAWSLTVTPYGISALTATLARIVPLGDYAVVSIQEAFARLSDPRFGASSNVPLFSNEGVNEGESVSDVALPGAPPSMPEEGAALPWVVLEVTIVSVRPALTRLDGAPGRSPAYLAPSYEFVDAEGGRWTVLAADEEELDVRLRGYPGS